MFIKKIMAVLWLLVATYSLNADRIPAHTSEHASSIDAFLKNIRSRIYKETLANGLTLLFYHQDNTPEVVEKVVYDVGSKDETSTEYGFAHLVEHMIFKGTQKLSEQDIMEIARKFGAELNAYTSYDRTTYYFDTDKKNWKVFLGILADCMQNVRMDEQQLASEFKVVFDELKMRDADAVGDVFAEMYPSNHPYHHPIVGYKENLALLDANAIRAFYKKYYRPDRATLIIVGDLNKDEVIREVRKVCETIPCPAVSDKCSPLPQGVFKHKNLFQKQVVVYKPIPDTTVCCLWSTPSVTDIKQALCARLIAKYLRVHLNDILHDQKALVTSVNVNSALLAQAGAFVIAFEPHDQKDKVDEAIETCKNTIIHELNTLIAEGLSPDECERAKRMFKIGLLKSFESSMGVAGILEDFYSINKNEYLLFDEFGQIDAVTNDDLKLFARSFLRPALMNVVIERPLKNEEKGPWQALQQTIDATDSALLALKNREDAVQAPMAAATYPKPELLDSAFEKPDEEFTLSNGLHVMLKRRSNVPFLWTYLTFKNRHNLSRLCAENGTTTLLDMVSSLLLEGSEGLSKDDHRKFFEDRGVSSYGSGLLFSCVASDFEEVARHHVLILSTPTYPQAAFDKTIHDMVQQLEQLQESEQYVAHKTLFKHICRDDYLSQKSDQEFIAEIQKYTRADLVALYDKYLAPRNMLLAVVGDFDASTIKQQLENTYGTWRNGATACFVEEISCTLPVLTNPDACEQSVYLPKERVALVAGRITVKKGDDDHAPLQFLEEYVNKMLFQLREQYGLFYGCNCSLTTMATVRQQGQAVVVSQLSRANVEKVVDLIKSLLRSIAENGVPADDFQNIHNSIVNECAKAYMTNFSVVSAFLSVKAVGDTWENSKQRLERLVQVTPEEVNAVAKTYLNPDKWSFVTVGRVGKP